MPINEHFSVSDKVAIVTGAAGGLGSELAKILLEAGAKVILVDKSMAALDRLTSSLDPALDYKAITCDLTKKPEIESLVEQCPKIDILVNCAGILGADAHMLDITESDWDAVFAVNIKGMWLLSMAVIDSMIINKIAGSIVNISSSLGARAQHNRLHYASSKAAVEHFTRNMAMEAIKYNIRVNCLAPGWTATPMVQDILDGPEGEKWKKSIPMGRAAKPEELTGALLLLASQASSYMTGSTIRVDGGYSYFGIES